MKKKYSIVAVAYKDVSPEVSAEISKHSVRRIKEASDLMSFCSYGRQMSQDTRVCIYLDWYKKNILEYLSNGYHVVLIEIPHAANQPIIDALRQIDEDLGDQVLVIEHDEV
jgi:hypothetical protein